MFDEGPTRRGLDLPAPTVRELAMVVFRQRRVFVCVSGLILAIALLYAFTGTRYQAHMKIMVRRGRADAVATARENAPVDVARMAITEEDLNSEVELLRDDEILRKVVEANNLAQRGWLRFLRPGEGRAAQIERATRRLAGKLRVESVKKTNLIAVTYGSQDPAVAAKVLQSLATRRCKTETAAVRVEPWRGRSRRAAGPGFAETQRCRCQLSAGPG
ncbi:MAG: hypothetical protein LAO24_18855 [Acidobacteriia bacterium]|nr:hypothetical protein [Terriglobia bacterium]